MNYPASVRYLESFWKFGIKPGLARIKSLLKVLGEPQKDLVCIHVAGTNGKGSTCAMTASIFKECGFKVGLYTSPHLVDYTERFKVNGKSISRAKFAKYCSRIRSILRSHPVKNKKPTEFELLTAIAFKYFSDEKVDIAVIETGLGGRLDSTNVIIPEVCAVTNIDLDHTELLGRTIRSVAQEKAGIIKSGVEVVVPRSLNKEALKVVRKVCALKKSTLIIANKAESKRGAIVRLKGAFQKENAGVVLEIMEVFRKKGWNIKERCVIKGFKNTIWPARFQQVKSNPRVLVDAGHNPSGLEVVAKEAAKSKKAVFVLGMLSHKDHIGAVRAVSPYAKTILACALEHPFSLDPALIEEEACRRGVPSRSFCSLKEGIKFALGLAGHDGIVCVAGSHVTAGWALKHFGCAPR